MLRIDLFRRPQPFRSTSFEPHCLRHLHASPPRDVGVEIRSGRDRLKSSRTANTNCSNFNVTTPYLSQGDVSAGFSASNHAIDAPTSSMF
jgi:hypothetical protein